MRRNLEREVKLVPPDGFRLADLGPELPPRVLVSTYLDTPGMRLARYGATLRYRLEDGAGIWQLKLPHGSGRMELEESGPPGRPPAQLLDLLPAYLRGEPLVRVARLRTRRRRVRLDGVEVVEDAVGVFDGPRIAERFRELEVELLDGDEGELERVVERLLEAGATLAPSRPKLFRVLGLDPPTVRPDAERGTPPLEVVRLALRAQHARLLAHDPGVRLGADPEDVHQMRVATRRARAFLRAARPLLDREWTSALRAELGWLGSALGPARDLDVLFEHLRGNIGEIGLPQETVRSLLDTLEAERSSAYARAVAALSDARYLALLERLEQAEPLGRTDGSGVTLTDLWRAELARTRKRFGRLKPSSSDEELHAARIQVKRVRYAAELAASELGKRGKAFVAAAKELQDILGEHQDACVAEDRIRAWEEREAAAEGAAELLLGRERERRERARAAWPAAWAELERRARKVRA